MGKSVLLAATMLACAAPLQRRQRWLRRDQLQALDGRIARERAGIVAVTVEQVVAAGWRRVDRNRECARKRSVRIEVEQ